MAVGGLGIADHKVQRTNRKSAIELSVVVSWCLGFTELIKID